MYQQNLPQHTRESKTAVMDVIVFLCASLGSSTVQLHDILGSRRACACSEAVSVVKMATAREEYTTEELCSVVLFFWAKRLNANDIKKEMFPVYGGKCLSRKGDHNSVANVSLMTKRLKRRCGSG
jgi:hypothetical protein